MPCGLHHGLRGSRGANSRLVNDLGASYPIRGMCFGGLPLLGIQIVWSEGLSGCRMRADGFQGKPYLVGL